MAVSSKVYRSIILSVAFICSDNNINTWRHAKFRVKEITTPQGASK
jgi:hypothetical protein